MKLSNNIAEEIYAYENN